MDAAPEEDRGAERPKTGNDHVLQERLYIVEEAGPTWRVRLSSVDRPLSVHQSQQEAVDAARTAAQRWAPARIRVFHSGQLVTEWYIRYPDGDWQESRTPGSPPPGPPPDLFGGPSSART